MEGSPNIVKQARGCNCPVVATDTGDIKWVLGETEGCYVTSFDVRDCAEKIRLALNFSGKNGRTNGKQRMAELGLDSETVAKKILEIYKTVIRGKINNSDKEV